MDGASGSLIRYLDLEAHIPARHPLRNLHVAGNEAPAGLNAEFVVPSIYVDCPSIAPEPLIRASRIQFHTAFSGHVDEAVLIRGHSIRFLPVDLTLPSAEIITALRQVIAPPVLYALPVEMVKPAS